MEPGPTSTEVRLLRVELGLTQQQAGAILGWTERAWRQIEDDQRSLSMLNWKVWKHLAGIEAIPFQSALDEAKYADAKPHFEVALKAFGDAGQTLKELFKFLILEFGEGIKPYALRFAKEKGLDRELAVAQEGSEPAPRVPTVFMQSNVRKAIAHWKEFQPKKYAELEAKGQLRAAAEKADEQTDLELRQLMQGGLSYQDAWEQVRERYLFPPEEDSP